MSNTAFETLRRYYPNKFMEGWHLGKQGYAPAFVIYQGDALHQNTIDDSNLDCIHEELTGEFPHQAHWGVRPYVKEVFVYVDDMKSDEKLAGRVLEIMRSFQDHAIYSEDHYFDLEHDRLVEYMHDDLVHEIAHELGRDDVEEIEKWIGDNVNIVWEHNDGSVDDVPFNVEKLAQLITK